MREEYDFSKLKRTFKDNHIKIPSLKIYQNYARIYLDEYEGQEQARKEYLAQRWQLESNDFIKKVA